MSNDEIAIRVSNLSKCYQIYEQPQDRLKQSIFPRLQRLVGKHPCQYFREFWALKDVSFEIKKGETVGVIGVNGSGKSTLLQLICGTLMPTSGYVETNGRIAALLELGSGFNPEFTGRENIYFNAALLGLSNLEIDNKFDNIASFADIGDFIDQPVRTYSSGMYVRLAFAVIAHVDADIIVVDEALAVGDAIYIQKCNRFIKKFLENGTLLFVSHSSQSILELCDRIIWLNKGELRKDGKAKDIVRSYSAFVHQQINPSIKISESDAATQEKLPGYTSSLGALRAPPAIKGVPFNVELFGFDSNSAYWGAGGATILNIELLDEAGKSINFLDGCGSIFIRVHCCANVKLLNPVIGISIRNNRGLELLSDNTYASYKDSSPPTIEVGEQFYGDFVFFLPYLPSGEYMLGAAVADGLPGSHVQHHRRDDALKFTVHSSHVVYGLFSMPLEKCCITLKPSKDIENV